MKPFIEHLAKVAPYYISAHPNAGLPNEMGQYDETAESMAPQIAEFIDEGIVNIIGGCCGTSPEFIAHYARSAEGKKPHQVVASLSICGSRAWICCRWMIPYICQ